MNFLRRVFLTLTFIGALSVFSYGQYGVAFYLHDIDRSQPGAGGVTIRIEGSSGQTFTRSYQFPVQKESEFIYNVGFTPNSYIVTFNEGTDLCDTDRTSPVVYSGGYDGNGGALCFDGRDREPLNKCPQDGLRTAAFFTPPTPIINNSNNNNSNIYCVNKSLILNVPSTAPISTEAKRNLTVQVAFAGEPKDSPNWRTVNHTGAHSVPLTEVVRVLGSSAYNRNISVRFANTSSCYSNQLRTASFRYSNPAQFTLYHAPPSISGVSITPPKCINAEDAAIRIPRIIGNHDTLGFTLSWCPLSADVDSCSVSGVDGPHLVPVYNAGGSLRSVCLPTKVFNYQETRTAARWASEGITFNSGTVYNLFNRENDQDAGSDTLRVRRGIWELQIEGTEQGSCPVTYYFEVRDPAPISVYTIPSLTKDIVCPGGEDGVITVSSAGGTGVKQYRINGSEFDSPSSFTGLSSGAYTVQAKDANGCESAIRTFEIQEHDPINLNSFVSSDYGGLPVSCRDAADGEISVSASGGEGSFSYSYRTLGSSGAFSNFNAPPIHRGLGPGSYEIKIQDSFCEKTDTATLNNPDPFTASIDTVINANCFGAANGSIALTLENFVGNLSFEINEDTLSPNSWSQPENPVFSLGAGNHTFTSIKYIVEDKECPATLNGLSNIPITQPAQLGFNRTDYVSPTCENSADGSLTIAGTGGSGNYRYRLNSESDVNESPASFHNLRSGTHILMVIDDGVNGCSIDTFRVNLPKRSDSLVVSASTTTPSCAGDSTGSITVSATGGDGPYRFAIDLGGELTFIEHSESHTFENLPGGPTYRIFVRDENYGEGMSSCEKILDVMLPDTTEIQANFSIDNVNCNGGSDGAIITMPSGGAKGYSYTWTHVGEIDVIDTEKDLVGVPAGGYELLIEDANGCTKLFDELEITEPEELLITGLTTSPETCEGRDDGEVQVQMAGGTTPYYYSLDGGPFLQNNSLFIDISSGNHSITVRDQNHCEVDSAFEISLITVQIAVEETRDLFCHEDGSGRIRLSGTGGQLPHSYSIYNGTDPQASNVFEGLQAGSYEAVVLDNSGCPSETIPLTLQEPEQLIGTLNIIQHEACGQSDGQAEVSVTGGTGDYTIRWRDSNLQTVDPLALRGGNYTVEVRDENNCTWQQPFSINNIAPPALSYVVEDSSWCGKPLGTATVNASGGFAPYQYLWDDEQQQETPTATDLAQSLYEVHVTDSRNCQSSIEVNMVDGQPLYLSSRITTPSACDTPEGTITISIAGGVAPYQYQWPDTVATASVPNVENLFPGIYPITITDSVECTLDLLLEVNSTEQPTIDTVIITPSYCELPTGSLYAEASDGTGVLTSRWLRGSNVYPGWEINELFAGEYLLEVSDENGCRAYRQAVIEDDLAVEPALSLVSYDSSACEKPLGRIEADMQGGDLPYTYSWNSGQGTPVIEDLYAGLYTLQATDGKGCVKNLQVRIADAADPVLSLTEITRSRCDVPTGSIAVQAALGTGSYQYFWSDDPERGISEATGLAFGDYRVYAEDGNGCVSNTLHLEVVNESNPDLRLAELGVVSCYGGNDGFAEVRVEAGNAPYTFHWNDPSSQTTARASNLEVGSYRVVVTDANGCNAAYDFQVAGPDSLYFSSIQVKDPLCYGVCTGDVTMAATGGNFPYAFSLQNEEGTLELRGANPSGLCDGEYIIMVEDRKGCTAQRRVSLVQASEITLDLPEQVDICEGGTYIADAGEWTAYQWSSGAGVISENRTATMSQPGEYYVRITTALGCQVYDTLSIDVRDDLMMADFLVKSEIIAGDTVQLIDISWPLPDAIKWFYPEGIVVIQENEDRITLLFPEAGEYDVSISASAGSCQDYWTNTIYVLDPSAGDASTGGRLGYHKGEIKSFILYPNPNTGSFTAAITLSEAAPITLELFEVQYGKVLKKYNGDQTDQYEVPFQESLKNGMYYLKLEALGDRKVIKFLVVR